MSIGYKWPILQDMNIRVADCYFWNQAYYISLGQEIRAGLFKEGICYIFKKEAGYDSQKKNTTRRISVCCTETSEHMIKNSLSLEMRSYTKKCSVIWLRKNFYIKIIVIHINKTSLQR